MNLETRPGCAGTDEAGRGPLAGPVVAAAVILPAGFELSGLNDSKKLTPTQRDVLELRILDQAVFAIEYAWPEEIDEKNILWASIAAMSRAVHKLSQRPETVFVDGNQALRDCEVPSVAVIKGDGKIAEIAAASVLAKNARDRTMRMLAKIHPDYGFENNFGYPTPEHLEILKRIGPCAIHRRSFAPVSAADQGTLFN